MQLQVAAHKGGSSVHETRCEHGLSAAVASLELQRCFSLWQAAVTTSQESVRAMRWPCSPRRGSTPKGPASYASHPLRWRVSVQEQAVVCRAPAQPYGAEGRRLLWASWSTTTSGTTAVGGMLHSPTLETCTSCQTYGPHSSVGGGRAAKQHSLAGASIPLAWSDCAA